MIHKISSKITSMLLSDNREYPQEVYTYGIEIILSSLLGCALVIVISALMGDILEGIIYIGVLSLIRVFAGGYHAETYLKCNIITVSSFCIALIVHEFCVEHSIVNPVIVIASAAFVFTVLTVCSPVDNKNKPVEENDRHRLKIISITIASFIYLVALVAYCFFGLHQPLISISALLVEAISIVMS